MDLKGEYRIPAPREKVWDALNDPEILRACIPGCDELVKISDTEMTAAVTTKIGPVKAKFKGAVTLENLNPPESYTIVGEGKGGAAGFAKGSAEVRLVEDGDYTILTYEAKAKVGGKLAQLGGRLIDATSKKMAKSFFDAFTEKLGGSLDQEESPIEHAVHVAEDAVHHVGDAVIAVEKKVEQAGAGGLFGGPQMWAILAVGALIIILYLGTS